MTGGTEHLEAGDMTTLLKNIEDGNSGSRFHLGQRFNPYRQFDCSHLPEQICRYKGISMGAKVVYARLGRYAGENGEAWPSMDTLGDECGISGSQAREYVQELVMAKFLEIESRKGTSNMFHFLWHPAFTGDAGTRRNCFTVRHRPLQSSVPPPLQKTVGVPVQYTVPPPLQKTAPEDSHHKESVERVNGNSQRFFSANAEPVQKADDDENLKRKPEAASPSAVPTDSGFKSRPSLNGESTSGLESLRNAPKPATDQEARELFRQLIALGPEADAENTILKIRKVLKEQDGAFIQFWELAKLTGAPEKVGGGYYVNLAKQMHYSRITALQEQGLALNRMTATAEKRAAHRHVCKDRKGCDSVGLLPDGRYCSCTIGQLAAMLVHKAGSTIGAAA